MSDDRNAGPPRQGRHSGDTQSPFDRLRVRPPTTSGKSLSLWPMCGASAA